MSNSSYVNIDSEPTELPLLSDGRKKRGKRREGRERRKREGREGRGDQDQDDDDFSTGTWISVFFFLCAQLVGTATANVYPAYGTWISTASTLLYVLVWTVNWVFTLIGKAIVHTISEYARHSETLQYCLLMLNCAFITISMLPIHLRLYELETTYPRCYDVYDDFPLTLAMLGDYLVLLTGFFPTINDEDTYHVNEVMLKEEPVWTSYGGDRKHLRPRSLSRVCHLVGIFGFVILQFVYVIASGLWWLPWWVWGLFLGGYIVCFLALGICGGVPELCFGGCKNKKGTVIAEACLVGWALITSAFTSYYETCKVESWLACHLENGDVFPDRCQTLGHFSCLDKHIDADSDGWEDYGCFKSMLILTLVVVVIPLLLTIVKAYNKGVFGWILGLMGFTCHLKS